MNKKRRQVVHLFVIVVLLLSGVVVGEHKSAYACSCSMSSGSFEEELASSDYVFDGVVTNMVGESSTTETYSSAYPVEWTFQVNGSWKGEVTEAMTIYSAASSNSCGYEFNKGTRYAVFAKNIDDTIEVSYCSKTSMITANSTIFDELGAYKNEVSVPTIGDLADDIGMGPTSSTEDNSNVFHEGDAYTVAMQTTSDQVIPDYTEDISQINSIENVNQIVIITFVIVITLLIVLAGMLIYKKNRK
ncbi:MAG TPA: hypothetical protein IAA29_11635 [Candidatus Paenibacillus intestinavium]|nr:hypothetical protein [Candidatus Paenibacillus intestinavium]